MAVLFRAARDGDTDRVDQLLSERDSVAPGDAYLALLIAAGHGNVQSLQRLLGTVDPSVNGQAVLVSAVRGGHMDAVRALLADSRVQTEPPADMIVDNTPLTAAASAGHFEIAKLLLASGETQVDSLNHKAMRDSAFNGRADIVALLAQHYPGSTLEDIESKQVVDCVREPLANHNREGAAAFLSAKGGTAYTKRCSSLLRWQLFHRADMQLLVDASLVPDGFKAALSLVKTGNVEDLEWLISLDGVKKEELEEEAGRLFWGAVEGGRLEVVRWVQTRLDPGLEKASAQRAKMQAEEDEEAAERREEEGDTPSVYGRLLALAPTLSMADVRSALEHGPGEKAEVAAHFGDTEAVRKLLTAENALAALAHAMTTKQTETARAILNSESVVCKEVVGERSVQEVLSSEFGSVCVWHAFLQCNDLTQLLLDDSRFKDVAGTRFEGQSLGLCVFNTASMERNDPMMRTIMQHPAALKQEGVLAAAIRSAATLAWHAHLQPLFEFSAAHSIPLPRLTMRDIFYMVRDSSHQCLAQLEGKGLLAWDPADPRAQTVLERVVSAQCGRTAAVCLCSSWFPLHRLQEDAVWSNCAGMRPGGTL